MRLLPGIVALRLAPRTCGEVNALNRLPCGNTEPETACHCARRGCCWGGDDLLASGVPNVPRCYYLYGSVDQVPYHDWGIHVDRNSTLTFATRHNARVILISGDGACGIAPPATKAHVAAGVDAGHGEVSFPVIVNEEGTFKVCLMDDPACLPDPDACDAPRFYTKRVGILKAFREIRDILGPDVECDA